MPLFPAPAPAPAYVRRYGPVSQNAITEATDHPPTNLPGVGKSCLLCRYSDDVFNSNFITTIGCAKCACTTT